MPPPQPPQQPATSAPQSPRVPALSHLGEPPPKSEDSQMWEQSLSVVQWELQQREQRQRQQHVA